MSHVDSWFLHQYQEVAEPAFVPAPVPVPSFDWYVQQPPPVLPLEVTPSQITFIGVGVADVAISKFDTPDPVVVDSVLVYSVFLLNSGPDPARDVVVVDTLPLSVDFVTAIPSQGSAALVGNVLTWNVGDLIGGAFLDVHVIPRVTGVISNTAEIESMLDIDLTPAAPVIEETTVIPVLQQPSLELPQFPPVMPEGMFVEPIQVSVAILSTIDWLVQNPEIVAGPEPLRLEGWAVSDVVQVAPIGWLVQNPEMVRAAEPLTLWAWVSSPPIEVAPIGWLIQNPEMVAQPEPLSLWAWAISDIVQVASFDWHITQPTPIFELGRPELARAHFAPEATIAEVPFVPAQQDIPIFPVNLVTDTAVTEPIRADVAPLDWLVQNPDQVSAPVSPVQWTEAHPLGEPPLSIGWLIQNADQVFQSIDARYLEAKTTPVLFGVTDIAITKNDNLDPVMVGDTLVWRLTVTNNGPDTASLVTVTDTLPAGVTFISAIPSQGVPVFLLGTVTWVVGTLPVGVSETLDITVMVTTASNKVNTATAVVSLEFDPDPSNDSDTEETTVNAAPATYVQRVDQFEIAPTPLFSEMLNPFVPTQPAEVAFDWFVQQATQIVEEAFRQGEGVLPPFVDPVASFDWYVQGPEFVVSEEDWQQGISVWDLTDVTPAPPLPDFGWWTQSSEPRFDVQRFEQFVDGAQTYIFEVVTPMAPCDGLDLFFQQALIAHLKNDAALVAFLPEGAAGIREEHWHGAAYQYPCVRVGQPTLIPYGGRDDCCQARVSFRVLGFSKADSTRNAQILQGLITAALQGKQLSTAELRTTGIYASTIDPVRPTRESWIGNVNFETLVRTK